MLLVKAFPRIPPISTFSSFINLRKEESDFFGNILHLHGSGEELKHRVESLNKGVKSLEHEGFLELPGASGLPLICEVGGQSHLVFLKGKVDELD